MNKNRFPPLCPRWSQGWIDIVDLSIARKPEPRSSPQTEDPPQPQKPKTGRQIRWIWMGLLDRLDYLDSGSNIVPKDLHPAWKGHTKRLLAELGRNLITLLMTSLNSPLSHGDAF